MECGNGGDSRDQREPLAGVISIVALLKDTCFGLGLELDANDH